MVPEFLGSEPYIITGESILRDYGESKRSHVVLKGKRNHLIKPRSQKKHRIPAVKGKWMPKHVIARSNQPNPFGHLSELLGIKGENFVLLASTFNFKYSIYLFIETMGIA